jgi:hypothetical protein
MDAKVHRVAEFSIIRWGGPGGSKAPTSQVLPPDMPSGDRAQTGGFGSEPKARTRGSPMTLGSLGGAWGTQLLGVTASNRRRTSDVFTPRAPSSTAAGSGGWSVRIWASTCWAATWVFRRLGLTAS